MEAKNLHDEIASVAYELYKNGGCIECRDLANWLEAEEMVLVRHASQELEEPEGEEAIISSEEIAEEVEGTEFSYAKQDKGKATVFEEMDAATPFSARKTGRQK